MYVPEYAYCAFTGCYLVINVFGVLLSDCPALIYFGFARLGC